MDFIYEALSSFLLKWNTMADAIQDNGVERRADRRYRSTEGYYLVENSESRQPIGDLLDISASGLSFIYSADMETIEESAQLNIITASGEIHVEQVFYQNKNDFDFIGNFPFNPYRMRRRGVRFVELTEVQRAALATIVEAIRQQSGRSVHTGYYSAGL
jgi:hypothetical protein